MITLFSFSFRRLTLGLFVLGLLAGGYTLLDQSLAEDDGPKKVISLGTEPLSLERALQTRALRAGANGPHLMDGHYRPHKCLRSLEGAGVRRIIASNDCDTAIRPAVETPTSQPFTPRPYVPLKAKLMAAHQGHSAYDYASARHTTGSQAVTHASPVKATMPEANSHTTSSPTPVSSQNSNLEVTFESLNTSQANRDASIVGAKPGDVIRFDYRVQSDIAQSVMPQFHAQHLTPAAEIIDSGLLKANGNIVGGYQKNFTDKFDHTFSLFARVEQDCGGKSNMSLSIDTGQAIVIPLTDCPTAGTPTSSHPSPMAATTSDTCETVILDFPAAGPGYWDTLTGTTNPHPEIRRMQLHVGGESSDWYAPTATDVEPFMMLALFDYSLEVCRSDLSTIMSSGVHIIE